MGLCDNVNAKLTANTKWCFSQLQTLAVFGGGGCLLLFVYTAVLYLLFSVLRNGTVAFRFYNSENLYV